MTTWYMSAVRILGSTNPLTGMLVQLQNEVDSAAIQKRLQALEDPVSSLHPQIRELTGHIYRKLSEGRFSHIQFDREFYDRYARPLALLEGQYLIQGEHTFGGQFYAGMIVSADLILYGAGLFEDVVKMDCLMQRVDTAPRGQWVKGEELITEIGVPEPIVRAVFEVYDRRGLGLMSQTVGETNYYAKA